MAVHTIDIINTTNSFTIDELQAGEELFVSREATLIASGAGSRIFSATTDSNMIINGELLASSHVIFATGGRHNISIGVDGVLSSAAEADAIRINGSDNHIFNAGEVSGAASAINIQGDRNEITNTGTLAGVSGEGLDVNGSSNALANHGTISAVDNDAVFFGGSGGHFILNTGVISALKDDGIQTTGLAGETIQITNSGVIGTQGLFAFSINCGGASDLVTNTGALIGGVDLDDGSDRFDTRLGTIVEDVFGGGGDDTILGSAGDDTFLGEIGDDALFGFGGDDVLDGDFGNDALEGGLGNDDLRGGDGVDTASYSKAAGAVTASLSNASSNKGEADGDSYSSIESITGSRFGDTLSGSGGSNTLSGGSGSDGLFGLGGADVLTGGTGADKFVFNTKLGAANIDQVTDFTVKVDKIHLENAIFKGLADGALKAGAFRVGTSAGDADDRIIYNKTTGAVLYDKDGKGGAAAVKFAELDPGLALKATDFFVI